MIVKHLEGNKYLATFNVKADALENRIVRFIASDNAMDRDGDVIEASGWLLDNWNKNPAILYAHNSWGYPHGKGIKAMVQGNKLIIDIYFPTIAELCSDPSHPSEQALAIDTTFHMLRLGLLSACSVGFMAFEKEQNSTGWRFTKQELLELSIVPVPANPHALTQLRSAGISEEGIKAFDHMSKIGARLSRDSLSRIEKIRECYGKIESAMAEMDKHMAVLLDPSTEEGEEEQAACDDAEELETGKGGQSPEGVFKLVTPSITIK